jgi:hypothetical protein
MWTDRVLELRRVPGREIADCPHQWKAHPEPQQQAIRDVLEQVGFAGALLCYYEADGTLTTVDGHGRKALAPDYDFPCLITDLNPDEVPDFIAAFDTLAQLAQPIPAKVAALRERLKDKTGTVRALLARASDPPVDVPDLEDAEADGDTALVEQKHEKRELNSKGIVRAVLYLESLDIFERALAATGEKNRARALEVICQHYVTTKGQ